MTKRLNRATDIKKTDNVWCFLIVYCIHACINSQFKNKKQRSSLRNYGQYIIAFCKAYIHTGISDIKLANKGDNSLI